MNKPVRGPAPELLTLQAERQLVGFREVKVIKPKAARALGDPFKPRVTFLFVSC